MRTEEENNSEHNDIEIRSEFFAELDSDQSRTIFNIAGIRKVLTEDKELLQKLAQ